MNIFICCILHSILDKLTAEKFDLVNDRLIEAGITRDDILEVWFIPSCLLNLI